MELTNKRAVFLGDSITEGSGVSDLANRYDNRLHRMLGLAETTNYGIAGTRIAHQSVPSLRPVHDLCFCGRAYRLRPDAELIIVYGGVNDYLHGDAPLGSPADGTPATFRGAVDFLIRLLKEQYPAAQLAFITPAHCHFYDTDDDLPSPHTSKTPESRRPLADYVAALESKCRQYGVPLLSLYDKLGIDPRREPDRSAYTIDGLHFNDTGHQKLAELMAEFLKSL